MAEINFFWEPLSDNIVQERDATGAVTAQYTTEPRLYGNLISQKQAAAPSEYQFHYDALGSTLVVTTNNPMNYATRAYSAFGETTESTGGTITFPFQYIGQRQYYRQIATGQYSVRRRLYDAIKARWLSKDAWTSHLASLFVLQVAINDYQYAANSPLLKLDPSGLYEVRIQVDAFIPDAWIMLVAGLFDLKGDNRDISVTPRGPYASRVTTIVKVEMERCIRDQDVLTYNQTAVSPSTRRFLLTYPPFEQTLLGTYLSAVTATRTGDCDVQIHIQTGATIPWLLAPSAPAINWDLQFDVHMKEYTGQHYVLVTGNIGGAHDGFPAYEAYVQDELEYYRRPSWTILALYPPLEVDVGASIVVRDIDKFAKCCECKDLSGP